jgi:hypothetical protein
MKRSMIQCMNNINVIEAKSIASCARAFSLCLELTSFKMFSGHSLDEHMCSTFGLCPQN